MFRNKNMRVGTVVGTIIMFLSIFSILCDLFHTNFTGFIVLSEFIKDANVFFTIICISYIIEAILKEENIYKFITVFLVDIILVNRLYSNKTWMEIITMIRNANKGLIVLIGIVIALTIYIVYEIIINKFNNKEELKTNYKISNKKDKKIDTEEQENNSDMNNIEKEINDSSRNAAKRGIDFFIRRGCIAIIIWGILDFVIYKLLHIGINRPAFFNDISSFIYYGAIISAGIWVALLVTKMEGNTGERAGNLSAVIALGVEICIIIFNNKINWSKISGNFLNAISDNWFVSVFAFIIFFMILQIAIIIIINMFYPKVTNQMGNKFRDSIKKVEVKMVTLACDIIEGCISLLDFIPDFFTTIGVLLLNLDNDENDGGAKDDEER